MAPTAAQSSEAAQEALEPAAMQQLDGLNPIFASQNWQKQLVKGKHMFLANFCARNMSTQLSLHRKHVHGNNEGTCLAFFQMAHTLHGKALQGLVDGFSIQLCSHTM